jgi:hypothetical protein
METIPVLYLSKTYEKNQLSPLYLRDIMKKQGFSNLYVIDEQGIKRNQPQYAFYQRFSPMFDLWVDTGPRDMGDVVDDIFSGAKRIIIRLNLWLKESLSQIRELTEHDIFLAVEGHKLSHLYTHPLLYEEADGLIVFMTSEVKTGFKNESTLNQVMRNKPVYVFDMQENESYWTSKKINGLLQDINRFV